MRYVRMLFVVVLVFILCSVLSLKKGEHKPAYVFGISASFTDTMIYHTGIQVLDNMTLDKNGLLPHREIYNYQPKNYLEVGRGQSDRTCMIYFSENRRRLREEAARVLDEYRRNQSMALEKINIQNFKFTRPEE